MEFHAKFKSEYFFRKYKKKKLSEITVKYFLGPYGDFSDIKSSICIHIWTILNFFKIFYCNIFIKKKTQQPLVGCQLISKKVTNQSPLFPLYCNCSSPFK